MQERRKTRRFSLKLHCLVTVPGNHRGNAAYQMETLNISSSGIYIRTVTPFSIGDCIDIDVMVVLPEASQCNSDGSCITLSGKVLRADANGMAVMFTRPYRITGLQKLISLNRTKTHWMEMMARKARGVSPPINRRTCSQQGHGGSYGSPVPLSASGPHLALVR